ncbi:MAG: hypothetical protein GWO24_16770 [Akkermansiaceae bacterium]|nr:hypothetical protein [Akkermansiaceae bacterium]
MAPEQFESLPLDARSDLYSLGAIFYYALTGCYAFGGENPGVVMEAHLSHSFVPLAELRPDLPAAVCTWVERLFSRRMEDRPASAREALISWSLEAVIDEVQLREAASDDPEIAEELLDSFVEEMSDFWGQLEAGLERRDGAAIVDLARSIRGSAATLGYVEIVSITRKIEKNATDNPADCAAVCAGFGPALDRLRDTIGRMAWQAGDGGQEGGEIT